jgi:hypothetical protein
MNNTTYNKEQMKTQNQPFHISKWVIYKEKHKYIDYIKEIKRCQ